MFDIHFQIIIFFCRSIYRHRRTSVFIAYARLRECICALLSLVYFGDELVFLRLRFIHVIRFNAVPSCCVLKNNDLVVVVVVVVWCDVTASTRFRFCTNSECYYRHTHGDASHLCILCIVMEHSITKNRMHQCHSTPHMHTPIAD